MSDLQAIRARRAGLAELKEQIDALDAALASQEEGLVAEERAHAQLPSWEAWHQFVGGAQQSPLESPLATRAKSNVQIYRDVLLEHGKPMHVPALYEAALSHGLRLRGKGDPREQVRNSLTGSKDFVNKGDNHWWVEGVPLPELHQVVGGSDLSMELTANSAG